MTKIKTADASGAVLDWLVAKCEQIAPLISGAGKYQKICYVPKGKRSYYHYTPSTNWKQGGPIVERKEIGVKRNAPCSAGREWEATPSILAKGAGGRWGYGPTPLVAAMRCSVASQMGEEVDVPEELLK